MKYLLLLLVLLFSCSSRVVNHGGAYIIVTQAGKIVQNKEILHGTDGEISFTFMKEKSKGMTPIVYIYGNIVTSIYPYTPGINSNFTYGLRYKFKKPGKATIMFIWESKNKFGEAKIINLEYL